MELLLPPLIRTCCGLPTRDLLHSPWREGAWLSWGARGELEWALVSNLDMPMALTWPGLPGGSHSLVCKLRKSLISLVLFKGIVRDMICYRGLGKEKANMGNLERRSMEGLGAN